MKNKLNIVIFFMLLTLTKAQNNANFSDGIIFQPEPKEIMHLGKQKKLDSTRSLLVFTNNNEEVKAANYLKYRLSKKFDDEINIKINGHDTTSLKIIFNQIIPSPKLPNNQYYEIEPNPTKNEVSINYISQVSILNAVATLAEFFNETEDGLFIHFYKVKDYPDYARRIISANPKPEEVFELLDFALQNKIETIAIASRQYPWFYKNEGYKELFREIKKWKDKFGGPNIMQMHNIYEEKEIEISKVKDIADLKEVIKFGIKNGAEKLMILADDTPPFQFGEGYILTTESDKKKFKHMADAHCFLMNELNSWLETEPLDSELYYVPPFYTYEDMHYGDMELYKNTPWDEDAYEPFYRFLNYTGLNMPTDVFIIWCGPYVRSRTITRNDINDWTYNLKGKIPFLWDNTIYSHNPYISTPLFSAWENDFPTNFHKITAGNGIFINGDVNLEDSKAPAITVNDYMWNSVVYSPQISISKAMNRLYGNENTELINELRKTELELRKIIGERELWFESDSLWKIIREIRYIHSKNPFYYHFNYTRMKALRLQLKNSVPNPVDKNIFIENCLLVDKKRKTVLDKLRKRNPLVTKRLEKLLIELPNLNSIQ